MTERK